MRGTRAVWLAAIVASLCLPGCVKRPFAPAPPPPAPAMRTCPDGASVPFGEQCPTRPTTAEEAQVEAQDRSKRRKEARREAAAQERAKELEEARKEAAAQERAKELEEARREAASKQATLQAVRLPDVIFPANRSDVNNCGMRVLLEELRPYMDRDPAGKVLLMGYDEASEGGGLDEQRASNAARVLTCAGKGPCANLAPSQVYVKALGTDQSLDFRPPDCGGTVKERAGQSVNAGDPRAEYRRVAVLFIPSGAPMPSFAADAPTASELPAGGSVAGGG